MLWAIKFQYAGVWISTGYSMYISAYLATCILHSYLRKTGHEPDIPQRIYCLRRGGSVY